MWRNMRKGTFATICVLAVFALGWELGHSRSSIDPISDAEAAGGLVRGPNEVAPDRAWSVPGPSPNRRLRRGVRT